MKQAVCHPNTAQTGAAAIYMVLIIVTMFTSSAIIIGGALSQQLRASSDVASSTRAFYAGASGIQRGLYDLIQLNAQGGQQQEIAVEGNIEYEEESAHYTGTAILLLSEDNSRALPCVIVKGQYQRQERRSQFGSTQAGCGQ